MIPPQENAEFVVSMEQVLDVYRHPYDATHPVVCMVETPRQLVGETLAPLPMRTGRVARHDYEYRRLGVCNVFMAAEPLAGMRLTKVTPRRTKIDWAHFLSDISAHYAEADKITLVMDNLNTHRAGALYEPIHRNMPRPCETASSSSIPRSTTAGSMSRKWRSMS